MLSQTHARVHAHLHTCTYTHACSHKHECKLVAVWHSLLSMLTLGSVPALLACHLCDQCSKNMFLSKQGRSWKEGCGPFHPHPSPVSAQKNSCPYRSRNRLEPVSTLGHLTECLTRQETRCKFNIQQTLQNSSPKNQSISLLIIVSTAVCSHILK